MRHAYKKSLEKLKQYAIGLGFTVGLNHDNTSIIRWKSNNKPDSINIEGVYNYEIQVYLFLHELGHHELRKDWSWYRENFPMVVRAEDSSNKDYRPSYRRRKGYYVASLEEEYCAWNEGLRLAKEFSIPVNLERWDSIKNYCLLHYLREI